MKSLIIIMLAVIAAQAAVIDTPDTIDYHYPDDAEVALEAPLFRAAARNNINIGSTAGNRLLRRVTVSANAIAGQIRTLDVTYRTNSAVRIRAVQAIRVGAQGSSARIISGGIGQASIGIRLQSARGRGLSYQLSYWGR